MSKSHYLRCKSLHLLPKFASETQRIHVGNGQYASVLFIIPIVIDIHSHRLEIFTLVLYDIPLLINQYSGSITIAKTMNNIRISHGYFIRSLGHCISH